MTALFTQQTPYGHRATLTLAGQQHILHGPNMKFGWAIPSAFEIRRSLTTPVEIYQSKKDQDAFFYVCEVGTVGSTAWHTITFVDITTGEVTTAYNALSYTQKGVRIYPCPD